MTRPNLDDPDYARFAWRRYRRLMAWMALVAAGIVAIGLVVLKAVMGTVPLHLGIAVSLGLFFSVLMAAALMGLVFLSSGSGHDEAVGDPFEDDRR